jgi:molybdenum cofactor guanylyltransferase
VAQTWMKILKSMKGLILAGGKSSRFGSDKSIVSIHGMPQREYLFYLLSQVCSEVFLSCKTSSNIPAHLNPLPDRYNFESPLNGIITALEHDPMTAWITVPVDMPNVDKEVVNFLIKNRSTRKIATCFFDSEGKFPEPLLAIWEPAALPLIRSFVEGNQKSPRQFLNHNPVEMLTSPFPNLHVNINTTEDLSVYREGHSRT